MSYGPIDSLFADTVSSLFAYRGSYTTHCTRRGSSKLNQDVYWSRYKSLDSSQEPSAWSVVCIPARTHIVKFVKHVSNLETFQFLPARLYQDADTYRDLASRINGFSASAKSCCEINNKLTRNLEIIKTSNLKKTTGVGAGDLGRGAVGSWPSHWIDTWLSEFSNRHRTQGIGHQRICYSEHHSQHTFLQSLSSLVTLPHPRPQPSFKIGVLFTSMHTCQCVNASVFFDRLLRDMESV